MNEVATARINTFGPSPKADFESPSEQLITLTYEQLQDLVRGAIDQAIQPLQKEIASLRSTVASLESLQEQDTNRICLDIAHDRQRLAKLEKTKREPGKTEASRTEKIERYLASRPDHKATFETLRGHLGIDKARLNEAIKVLITSSPGRYAIVRAPGDKRKRILVMLPN